MPAIPEKQLTVANISAHLQAKRQIWAWYSLLQKPNDTVFYFLDINSNRIDGFGTWILIGDYIYAYVLFFDSRGGIYLRLQEILRMTNSNILALINSKLKDAYCVMYDEQNHALNCHCLDCDITPEMVESEMSDKEKWIIGSEHFPQLNKKP